MLEKYSEEQLKKNYLTRVQASELLNVSKRTIDRYIATGELKLIQIKHVVYIEKNSLEEYLEKIINRK